MFRRSLVSGDDDNGESILIGRCIPFLRGFSESDVSLEQAAQYLHAMRMPQFAKSSQFNLSYVFTSDTKCLPNRFQALDRICEIVVSEYQPFFRRQLSQAGGN